jgi:hypothetical protein
MTRKSISYAAHADVFPKHRVGNMGDCNGKRERINDHVCGVQLVEAIDRKLESAEQGGFVDLSAEDMLAEFKAALER